MDLTVEVCGMSGDGTIAAGGLLNQAVAGLGLSVMAFDTYPAEIRGFGRCVTRSRFGNEEMVALGDRTQVLISLDDEQSLSRVSFLAPRGTVIFDDRPHAPLAEGASLAAHVEAGTDLVGLPLGDLSAGVAGSARSRNIVALGGFAALFAIPAPEFHQVIRSKFESKGEEVVDINLRSFDAGYEYVQENFSDRISDILSLGLKRGSCDRVLLSGNTAIARGILDAKVKYYYGYPITPATPVMEYLAGALPDRGGKLVQMEDEISSLGAVLGSFYAGERAVTATSGPGFALMTEMISHGVMAEIPAVVINAQRGGPSTGLPTKTEQSDLHAAVFGGPGDSARIVLAPTDVEECYRYTLRSFKYAEKYQTPVIVLTDFFLHNRVETVCLAPAAEDEAADANLYPDPSGAGRYGRYEVTEDGISPRAIPGMDGFMFTATGLEHTPRGVPDYSPDNHMTMNAKRHRKIQSALNDLPLPQEFSPAGPLEIGVVAWGSTFGSALEAVRRTWKRGVKAGVLKIISIYPYHAGQIRAFMKKSRKILIPELNYEGQLTNLIGHLGSGNVVRMNRTTGQPLLPGEVSEAIEKLL